MQWMLGVGAALLAVIVGLVVFALRGGDDAVSQPGNPAVAEIPVPDVPPDGALPGLIGRGEDALLAEAEPLARRFLEAGSIEEMLPLLREPERAKPRMQRTYPDGRIDPPGMADFNAGGNVVFGDGFVTVGLHIGSFEARELTFVETGDGLKIDWESWAGWSEMTWPELLAERPTEGKPFRVTVRKVEYYNYGFSDDLRWQSYRLESPDGKYMIFGYVERESILAERMQMDPDVDHKSLILKIRFPVDATETTRQVIIEEMSSDSWVETSETP